MTFCVARVLKKLVKVLRGLSFVFGEWLTQLLGESTIINNASRHEGVVDRIWT